MGCKLGIRQTNLEINLKKLARNTQITKNIFNKIQVGTKLNVSYKGERGKCKSKALMESVNVHDAVVFQKSDKIICIRDIKNSNLKGSISFGDLISRNIKVVIM